MIELGRSCVRHRSALIDFVDRGEIGPPTARALAHLDHCRRCTDELETTILAIAALRRIGDEASRIEPSADAWPRLRARIDRWSGPRRTVMSPVAGLAMSVAIVVVLVVPIGFNGRGSADPTARPLAAPPTAITLADRRIEAAYITSTRHGTFPEAATSLATDVEGAGSFPRNWPDNVKPERKEVGPAEPSGRPPEAI